MTFRPKPFVAKQDIRWRLFWAVIDVILYVYLAVFVVRQIIGWLP